MPPAAAAVFARSKKVDSIKERVIMEQQYASKNNHTIMG
jgi:hypothetical protein